MKSRVSFVVSAMVIAAFTCVHAGDALQISDDVQPEIAAMQADQVGPVKPVIVVNPPAQPVPVDGQVRVVNVPDVNVVNPVQVVQVARTPKNILRNVNIQDGEFGSGFSDMFTVPEGKLFVLTHASAAITESSQVAFRVDVGTQTDFLGINDIPGTRSGPLTLGGSNSWAMSVAMEIYVPAGQTVTCSAIRGSSSGAAFGRCSISGYVVDAPQ